MNVYRELAPRLGAPKSGSRVAVVWPRGRRCAILKSGKLKAEGGALERESVGSVRRGRRWRVSRGERHPKSRNPKAEIRIPKVLADGHRRNPKSELAFGRSHETLAFRTRKKAGGCPAVQTLARVSGALAEATTPVHGKFLVPFRPTLQTINQDSSRRPLQSENETKWVTKLREVRGEREGRRFR